ncbi:MAG TPA: prepilin-type N-terminal cleavage/methylation domain-containing protein [Blastocatellia bacterium]|jgi:Tfp pilus assembly protein FimT|nr:prepilin-type N-terminal cleavage/methylation domain-containing protein [Blastocatellia bacterium]
MTMTGGRPGAAGTKPVCNSTSADPLVRALSGVLSRGCDAPGAVSRAWNSSRGVSIVETVIVLAVLAILASGAIFQFGSSREAYNADDAANRLLNYFREANSRAVSDHHSFRVVINLSSGNISLIDEKTSATGNDDGDTVSGDDLLLKREPVATRVSFSQPSGVNPPAAPFNFSAATFTSSIWTGHFQSDGRVTATFGGAPVSCTFFLQPADKTNMPLLIRAVTLFGATSSARYWMYSGTKLVQG